MIPHSLVQPAFMGTSASLYWYLLPIAMSSIALSYRLNEQEVGVIASAFGGGHVLASIVGIAWSRGGSMSLVFSLGSLGATLSFAALLWSTSFLSLCTLHCLAGFFSGSVYCAAIVEMGRQKHPTRAIALLYLCEIVVALIVAILFDADDSSERSAHSMLVIVAASFMGLGLLATHAANWRQTQCRDVESLRPAGLGDLKPSTLPLLSVLLCFSGFTGMYVFLDLEQRDFVATASNFNVVVANISAGVLGSIVAITLEEKLGVLLPMAASIALALTAAALMLGTHSHFSFAAGVVLHGFAWNLGAPYRASLVARSTPNGEAGVLTSGVQSAGDALGPLIVGSTILGFGWAGGLLAASSFLLSGLLVFAVALALNNSKPLLAA